jgi:NitT/TauT family transport system permease protein
MTRAGSLRIAIVLGAIAALELVTQAGLVSRHTIIPPTAMAAALWVLIGSGEIMADITKTLSNVAAAFVLSVAGGFVLGLLIHAAPRLRRALDPLLATYYAVPFFVFYPLLIVIFGMSDLPIIVIGFLFGVVAMIIATLNGLDRVPRVALKVARLSRMDPVSIALIIKLPAATPYLFTGVKLAVAYSFIGVIASEFILSGAGLGFAIAYAYNNFDTPKMYALMLFILVSVTAVNMVLHMIEQRMLRRRGLAR